MKEKYETPVCEVIEFETEDVITTSEIGGGIGGIGGIGLGEGGNQDQFLAYDCTNHWRRE